MINIFPKVRATTRDQKYCRTVLAILAIAVAPGFVHSQTVSLRMAGLFPATQPMVSHGDKVFLEEVSRLTNKAVDIKYFPTEQLGKAKDMPDALKNGLVDISPVSPAYSSEKFPLSGVAELPGMFTLTCKGAKAMTALAEPGGVIYENELKPAGLRMLAVMLNDPYKIMTAKADNAKSIKSLAGLKIRTAGGSMDLTARSVDAAPVRMAGPDVLVALQRGTLDGLLWPILSVKPWGVDGPLKAWVSNVSVGSFILYITISDKAWSKLKPEMQAALTEAGKRTTAAACNYMDSSVPNEIPKLEAAGMRPVEWSADDVKQMVGKFEGIHTQWAENLNKQGKPGAEVLKAFREQLK